MSERSLPWEGTTTGDAGPYTSDEWRLVFKSLGSQVNPNEGILGGILDSLRPSSPGNNSVRIEAGRAIVDGTFYEADVAVTKTITSPSVGTTGKRLVLRKSWAAQTVRITEISSADGTGTIPALTQTDLTTWDIPLCSFTIDTGGVISAAAFTDNREFTREATINVIIDGAGAVIASGVKGDIEIPFPLVVLGWTLLADQSGSIVIDLWKDTYANYPPTVADTVTGTEKPTLASTIKNQDLTLTSWNRVWASGDIVRFNVDSAATILRISLSIRVAAL